jgi:hypothetical protein
MGWKLMGPPGTQSIQRRSEGQRNIVVAEYMARLQVDTAFMRQSSSNHPLALLSAPPIPLVPHKYGTDAGPVIALDSRIFPQRREWRERYRCDVFAVDRPPSTNVPPWRRADRAPSRLPGCPAAARLSLALEPTGRPDFRPNACRVFTEMRARSPSTTGYLESPWL